MQRLSKKKIFKKKVVFFCIEVYRIEYKRKKNQVINIIFLSYNVGKITLFSITHHIVNLLLGYSDELRAINFTFIYIT